VVLTSIIAVLTTALAVGVHYEALRRLESLCDRHAGFRRARVIIGAVGAILAHIIEVWIYAIGSLIVLKTDAGSQLVYVDSEQGWESLNDLVYYSFVCYTSLGFGDIVPDGPIRFFTALETLIGLVMIAWTASFMFLQMQQSWLGTDRP